MSESTKDIGDDLENRVARQFEQWGWTTIRRTKQIDRKGNAHEIDVLATKLVGGIERKVAVECKNWAGSQVGEKDARDFYAKLDFLRINEGIFIATKGFSQDALKLLHDNHIKTCINLSEFRSLFPEEARDYRELGRESPSYRAAQIPIRRPVTNQTVVGLGAMIIVILISATAMYTFSQNPSNSSPLNGDASSSSPSNKEESPEIQPSVVPGDQLQSSDPSEMPDIRPPVEEIPSNADYLPPSSDVIIKGVKNCYTLLIDRCWYYGNYPVAEFTASDISGIKHIVVWYSGTYDGRCKEGECLLKPGDTLILNEHNTVNKGEIQFTYFAVDSKGNAQNQRTVSLWVDVTKPQLYVRKIHAETGDNVPIEGGCDVEMALQNCVVISAGINETMTFELLGSDMGSGLNATLYRIIRSYELSSLDTIPWVFVGGIHDMQKTDVRFDKKGSYFVQFKAVDVAGNESDVKTYLIKVL